MHWSLIYLLSEWIIRLIMLVYVPQRRSAAASRTWLLFIFLLPWPGLVAFALFGRIYLPKRRIQMQERASRHIREAQAQMSPQVVARLRLPSSLQTVPVLAEQLGDFEAFAGNQVELLPGYDQSIDRLVTDIDSAQHHVHLLYYIYGNDKVGQRVAEALARAAARGVKCRVMMDAVGSKHALKRLAPQMRDSKIEVRAMLPAGLFRRNAARFDLRNHRKIAVIDGRIGYTGSQNITHPHFVKGFPNEELVARVSGPVVAQFQAVFLADHYFEAGRPLDETDLFPPLQLEGDSAAQVVPSGPGYGRANGEELIIAMLYGARKRVVITTPYFIPDDPFLQALRSATRRGVEIRLIVSRHANQPISQMAQRSYYESLLEAGVNLHLYRQRFLHAKHLSIDDDTALIGTTNIDIRSFSLNAEINLVVYDPKVVAKLSEIQDGYLAHSTQLSRATWEKVRLPMRVLQNTARLADSLL